MFVPLLPLRTLPPAYDRLVVITDVVQAYPMWDGIVKESGVDVFKSVVGC